MGRRPLVAFAVLACVLGWIFVILRGLGVDMSSGLLPLGPIIAAAIVSAALGKAELARWGRRLIALRTAPVWYLVPFLVPVAILGIAVLVNSAFGAPLPTREQLSGWTGLGPAFLGILIFIGVGEEAGWTAFAAPLLFERHRFIRVWLVLGAIRVAWHLPLMLTGELPWFIGIVGNMAFQFLLLWTFRRSGVWFLAALWHTVHNTVSAEFLSPMMAGPDRARFGIIFVMGYVLVAVVVWVVDRRRLN